MGAQGVAADPGGNLVLLGHGCSFFRSAWESRVSSGRERSERERLSYCTEQSEGVGNCETSCCCTGVLQELTCPFTNVKLNRTCTPIRIGSAVILAVAMLLTGTQLGEALSSAPPCAQTLALCPLSGCPPGPTFDPALNTLKRNTHPTGQTTLLLTLDDFGLLQAQAQQRVQNGPSVVLTSADRQKLRGLSTPHGQVSERALVAVAGYIKIARAETGGEAVNCHLRGADNNDFHIALVRAPTDDEHRAIVVETTPQERPAGWTLPRLTTVANEARLVLVRGQLLYDSKHDVNGDPSHDIRGQPKRFSLWEIHPVTEFHVCFAQNQHCDPQDINSGWQALANL